MASSGKQAAKANPLVRAQSKLASLSRQPFNPEFSKLVATPFHECLEGADELRLRALNVQVRTDIISTQIGQLLKKTGSLSQQQSDGKQPRGKGRVKKVAEQEQAACTAFDEDELTLKLQRFTELKEGKQMALNLDVSKVVGGRKRKRTVLHQVELKTRRTLDSTLPDLVAADATAFQFDRLREFILPFTLSSVGGDEQVQDELEEQQHDGLYAQQDSTCSLQNEDCALSQGRKGMQPNFRAPTEHQHEYEYEQGHEQQLLESVMDKWCEEHKVVDKGFNKSRV